MEQYGGCTDLCGFTELHSFYWSQTTSLSSFKLDFFSRIHERGEQAYNALKSQQLRPIDNVFATIWPASGLPEHSKIFKSALWKLVLKTKFFILRGIKLCKTLLKIKTGCLTVQELCKNTPYNIIHSTQALFQMCIGDKRTQFEINWKRSWEWLGVCPGEDTPNNVLV